MRPTDLMELEFEVGQARPSTRTMWNAGARPEAAPVEECIATTVLHCGNSIRRASTSPWRDEHVTTDHHCSTAQSVLS